MDVLYLGTEAFIELYAACVFVDDPELVSDVSVCDEVMTKEDYLGLFSLYAIEGLRDGFFEVELDVSRESCW